MRHSNVKITQDNDALNSPSSNIKALLNDDIVLEGSLNEAS